MDCPETSATFLWFLVQTFCKSAVLVLGSIFTLKTVLCLAMIQASTDIVLGNLVCPARIGTVCQADIHTVTIILAGMHSLFPCSMRFKC